MRQAAGISGGVEKAFEGGALGVNAFFVLSGFVVALSVSKGPWSFGYLNRFVLRRSVRLDPPYWAAISLELALGIIGMRLLGAKAYPLPSFTDLLAHLTYTQDILQRPQISDVFWTLCFEIQFYLALVGLLVLATRPAVRKRIAPQLSLGGIFLVVMVLSLGVRNGWMENPLPGTGLVRAHEFLVGVLCALWCTDRLSRVSTFIVLTAAVLTRTVAGGYVDGMIMLAVFSLCTLSFRSPSLDRFADVEVLQYLGRVSYSVYLFHASIIGRVSSLLLARSGPGASVQEMAVLLFASIAFTLFICVLLHHLIERPSLLLSRRIAIQKRVDASQY